MYYSLQYNLVGRFDQLKGFYILSIGDAYINTGRKFADADIKPTDARCCIL
jgi:hypothetical protein